MGGVCGSFLWEVRRILGGNSLFLRKEKTGGFLFRSIFNRNIFSLCILSKYCNLYYLFYSLNFFFVIYTRNYSVTSWLFSWKTLGTWGKLRKQSCLFNREQQRTGSTTLPPLNWVGFLLQNYLFHIAVVKCWAFPQAMNSNLPVKYFWQEWQLTCSQQK